MHRYAPGDLSGYSGERNPASAVIRHPVPISLVPAHSVQAQLQAGALSTSSTVRSDNGSQIISVYHSSRVRRASTAINHYYPDRTHSCRVPHSYLASWRSFIHARPVTVVPRESARGCLTHPSREHHLVIYHNITMDDFCLLIISWRFTIRGNNLKLRNHSRELITGPRACPLAR